MLALLQDPQARGTPLLQSLADVPFVPFASGKTAKPSELYDPSDPELVALLAASAFPEASFAANAEVCCPVNREVLFRWQAGLAALGWIAFPEAGAYLSTGLNVTPCNNNQVRQVLEQLRALGLQKVARPEVVLAVAKDLSSIAVANDKAMQRSKALLSHLDKLAQRGNRQAISGHGLIATTEIVTQWNINKRCAPTS